MLTGQQPFHVEVEEEEVVAVVVVVVVVHERGK
jgi:hypothetical protein